MNIGFVSLGCSKNLIDTESMIALVKEAGYNIVSDKESADIIIINTCGFIDDAKEEAINEILETAKYKEEGKLKKLIVAGCLAQRYSKEIETELPEVDKIVGIGSFQDIVKIIEDEGKLFVGEVEKSYKELDRVRSTPPYTAYLKIAEGCDNHCTYCAIPAIRGKYRSRKMEDILAEAGKMVAEGVTEVNIIAQDTTRYGIDLYGESKLAELMSSLAKLNFKWIRVLYTYPELISDELINVFKENDNILNYFDIPLQHVSDGVLKRMGRQSDKKSIYALLDKIRGEIEDVTLRTSLMVGFPGETDEDFEELCEFVKYARFDRMGVFKYSREEGTPAYKLQNQVDEDIKQQRFDRLMSIQNQISAERNMRCMGKTVEVLAEEFTDEYLYAGRSRADAPDIDGRVYFGSEREIAPGEYVRVKILGAEEYDLMGEEEKGR